tara:strand:+ start:19031 stop:19201 length:171 start_codon:yes stop_codon:yes gene_type:complete
MLIKSDIEKKTKTNYDAYRMGVKAASEGIDENMSPFEENSEKYIFWFSGWKDYQSK